MRLLLVTCTLIPSALLGVPALHGQETPADYPVKKCEEPKEPVGFLRGGGVVTYLLGRDGKPDTGSVQVLAALDLSVAGFRSAVVRQLSACRLDVGSHKPDRAISVVEEIEFDLTSARVRPARAAPDSGLAPVHDSTAFAAPASPLELSDPRLEERPRRLACDYSRTRAPGGEQYRSRKEQESAMREWERENSGTIKVHTVVGADGRIVRDSITVISSTNVAITNKLVDALASCRYAPGRMHGVPVPVAVTADYGLNLKVQIL